MVVLKSNYIKGGGSQGANYVSYIGTRDRVEKNVQKYVDYISNRKGVEKFSSHGLFTSGNVKIVLSQVQEEISNHKGNVWLPIISLTREDAVTTGYDNGTAWKNLLSQLAPKIAEYYKINIDNLCWYASFHDESYHPHVHMVVYSKDENEGYLTKKGIEKFKSILMSEIYRLQLEEVYKRQTLHRDELKLKCKEIFSNVKIDNSPEMLTLILDLKQALTSHKGKKSYGYLKKIDKEKVDKIINELEKIPQVKEIYDLWLKTKNEIYANYSTEKKEQLPLSEQKEFRSIKNMVISEVDSMQINLNQQNDFSVIKNNLVNLISKLEKLFTDEIVQTNNHANQRIDRKALSKLIEKKQAKGQKHTGEDLENDNQYSMNMQ